MSWRATGPHRDRRDSPYWSLRSLTYPGPTTMGTPTARGASQPGSGSFFGPERLAVPPHHAGVNVDDEPPARRVAWVAADRPRVGHEGTGGAPEVRGLRLHFL